MKQRAVIVDMDGTLADVSGIRHYVKRPRNEKDFESFHGASIFAPVNTAPLSLLLHIRATDPTVAIFVVTARRSKWERHTRAWLAKHDVPYDALCMRGNRDTRPDTDVKRDILRRIRTTHSPFLAIDDNPAVIALWAEEGITTYVVPGWETE